LPSSERSGHGRRFRMCLSVWVGALITPRHAPEPQRKSMHLDGYQHRSIQSLSNSLLVLLQSVRNRSHPQQKQCADRRRHRPRWRRKQYMGCSFIDQLIGTRVHPGLPIMDRPSAGSSPAQADSKPTATDDDHLSRHVHESKRTYNT
jgi:hypothetical protein